MDTVGSLAAWRVTCALPSLPTKGLHPFAETMFVCVLKTFHPEPCCRTQLRPIITRRGNGTGMSQRLRRAADDLKRMQAEYEEIQMQVHGEREASPRAPSGTTEHPSNDHTSEEVGRFSDYTTWSGLYHRRSSFRPGHRHPRHGDTSFERQHQPSPGFLEGGREHRERWETNGERIENCPSTPPSLSEEETHCSLDAARYDTSVCLWGYGLTLFRIAFGAPQVLGYGLFVNAVDDQACRYATVLNLLSRASTS